jgi:AcrR family transcriptional regulator
MEIAPLPADRRARRSRRALMRAAVALVGERGSTNVPVSDLAEAADVSRQLVYQQFGDRDTLLLEAALDLATDELVRRPPSSGCGISRGSATRSCCSAPAVSGLSSGRWPTRCRPRSRR